MSAPDAALTDDLDRIAEDDRRWFEQHPGRCYRLRGCFLAEIPPGLTINRTVRVLVRSLSPSLRLRLRVVVEEGFSDGEGALRRLWRQRAAQYPELAESHLRDLAATMKRIQRQGGQHA